MDQGGQEERRTRNAVRNHDVRATGERLHDWRCCEVRMQAATPAINGFKVVSDSWGAV